MRKCYEVKKSCLITISLGFILLCNSIIQSTGPDLILFCLPRSLPYGCRLTSLLPHNSFYIIPLHCIAGSVVS